MKTGFEFRPLQILKSGIYNIVQKSYDKNWKQVLVEKRYLRNIFLAILGKTGSYAETFQRNKFKKYYLYQDQGIYQFWIVLYWETKLQLYFKG